WTKTVHAVAGEILAGGYGFIMKEPTAGYIISNIQEARDGFDAVFEISRAVAEGADTIAELQIRSESGSAAANPGSLAVFRQTEGGWQPQTVSSDGENYRYMVSDTGKYGIKYGNVYRLESDSASGEFKFIEVKQRVFTPDESSPKANRCIFSYQNPAYDAVTIKIFDVAGCLVRNNLASNGSAGTTEEQYWDGRDGSGSTVKAGVYIYQIESGKTVQTGTVVVAK
ncbi:MAG: FlgD immunoglobulin-like domain containing protein, partial [Elusimicrobiaceae bacterium]|nr:FlgD immunoglobulin-like domain containing protein [Elusimicrobiaceae bacterium]